MFNLAFLSSFALGTQVVFIAEKLLMFFRAHYGVGTPFLEAPGQNWYLNTSDLKMQGQPEAEVWFPHLSAFLQSKEYS